MSEFKAYRGHGRNRQLLKLPVVAEGAEDAPSSRTRLQPILRGIRDYADSRRKDLVSVVWRQVTEGYLLAVAVMAAVILGGLLLLLAPARPGLDDPGLIGRIAGQQTLALTAVAELRPPLPLEAAALPELAVQLDRIAGRMLQVHDSLTTGTAAPAHAAPALREHYFGGPWPLDRQMRDFVAALGEVVQEARRGVPPAPEVVETLRRTALGPLQAAQQGAIRLHEAAADAAAADRVRLKKAYAALALLILALEAVFIFRPLARRVSQLTERLDREARTDSLTGLLNRRAVTASLTEVLASGQPVAVIAVDLDHFKEANDAEGHEAGDALLRAAAQRLKSTVRACDIVGRIGGDEFAVFLIGVNDHDTARETADRISTALHQPVLDKGRTLRLGATLGVAVAPVDADTADVVLRAADEALVRAKREGRGGIGRANRADAQRFARGAIILRAFDSVAPQAPVPGLSVHFQPIVSLRGKGPAAGKSVAFEALARWTHPELGQVPPEELLGLLGPARTAQLGRLVREEALRTLAALRFAGLTSARMAVNLSAAEIARREIAVLLEEQVGKAGLMLSAVEIEITEEVLLDRVSDQTLNELAALRGRGARLVLDDFGTGNSGLEQLLRLPLDAIKLDKKFIRRLGIDSRAEEIIRATVSLAQGLGIAVTAEGVETERQAAMLRGLGCDSAQGFLYAHPMPAEALEAWLREAGQARRG